MVKEWSTIPADSSQVTTVHSTDHFTIEIFNNFSGYRFLFSPLPITMLTPWIMKLGFGQTVSQIQLEHSNHSDNL